jgi:nicotinamide-nucleotide amidase
VSVRAGIVVTGTEVLTGRVVDRNGPWLSDRLTELGVEHAYTVVVGDRPQDVDGALRFFAEQGCDLVVTSGGLGPTEDDLTAQVVADFQARPMALDVALEERIWQILESVRRRWPNLDEDAIRASNRKQAMVPDGAAVLEPVGTAPGLVVPPPDGGQGPLVVVLPGPPRELQPMWDQAVEAPLLREVLDRATDYEVRMLRLFGIPESEIAETLRVARDGGVDIDALEITTCLRRGEVEVVTRYEPHQAEVYRALEAIVRERHAHTLFSDDGSLVDDQVADALQSAGETIAVVESCTGGLVAARLTDRPGASAYMRGGIVAYDNAVKSGVAGVDAALVAGHGAVSEEVARGLAAGAIERLGADVGIGITGIAGPEGGTAEKPVGLVWFAVAHRDGRSSSVSLVIPGARADVRDRATTVALHLVRRLLVGSGGLPGA